MNKPAQSSRRLGARSGVTIHELCATRAAIGKLGARGISTREAEQVPRNRHVTVRNPRAPRAKAGRLLLIGQTDGGRRLTLVVEPTEDASTWLIVTGWPATDRERTLLDKARR